MSWLLLLHQIPPAPPYFRAKVLRRLNQLGALPIKNSAYLLPASDDAMEDFEWLRREILDGGGEAWIFAGEAGGGWSDAEIHEAFRRLRAPDYEALAEEARALAGVENNGPQLRKLERRFEELKKIDYFDAPGREQVEVLMKSMGEAQAVSAAAGEYQGRTWVTRKGIKVDRIGSGWLIRRFIDPAARFVFVDPQQYRHTERELRFDMFEGEFTHQGEMCTFEVLLRFFGLEDKALQAVAEVVHDIDLKDSRFQRSEAGGLAPLIEGIALLYAEDVRRLEEGGKLFEALYARFQTEAK
jgi:hypothetical protein